jgi:heme/copper-type cytochrome/quinol oxidase subunit 2
MSRKSRKKQHAAPVSHKQASRFWHWVLPIAGLVLLAAFTAGKHFPFRPKESPSPVSRSQSTFVPPAGYAELCSLDTNALAHCDIALMNLLCTEGLRGTENLNLSNCLTTLDRMAAHVKFETDRHLYKFFNNKAEFNNSEGYYRVMMMATVLQQDWGIHYNPDHIQQPGQSLESNNEFFANSQDVFIHGLLRRGGAGTCSSMPVFYVAVGRRLGYPLKLVKAKGHLFARWVDGHNSFNIEGTTVGFGSYDDDHYRNWPIPFTAEEEQAEGYLKPLTPSQELSVFLSIRGMVLDAANEPRLALGAYAHAFRKDPDSQINRAYFIQAERRAFVAGALPRRQSLGYEVHELVIPIGANASFLMQEKQRLQAISAGKPLAKPEWFDPALRREHEQNLPIRGKPP